MIKLTLASKPSKLTTEKQNELTEEFINSGKVVWKYKYIYNAVRKMSYEKCCFSEIKLNTRSTYLEVEHFYPKNLYPDQVVEWGNLLPSSKKCNTTKGDMDTKVIEIVNPFVDDPKDYLYFENFRLYPKNNSTKGQNTIETVALNDRHFVSPRAKLTLEILDCIGNFHTNFIIDSPINLLSNLQKQRKINQLKGYLSSVNRENDFSACIATAVYDSNDFKNIKTFLSTHNLWDNELESYEQEILYCYLGKTM